MLVIWTQMVKANVIVLCYHCLEKFYRNRDLAFMDENMFNIAKSLDERCLFNYNHAFFQQFVIVECYATLFEKFLMNEKL